MDKYYVITNGHYYLKSDCQITQTLSGAGKWNQEKANSVFESIEHSKKYRNYNFTVKVYEEIEFQTELLDISNYFDIKSLMVKLTSLAKISKEIINYNEFLNQQYKIVELEINDIQHYIEFTALDACKGYKAFKLLKEKLNLRRQIKDEQLMIDKLIEVRLLKCEEEEINKAYTWLDSRQYNPRVLRELFE